MTLLQTCHFLTKISAPLTNGIRWISNWLTV